jgi:DNA repair exonuclease SbcCD ATPase subunit
MANEREQRPPRDVATCPYCGQPLQGEEAVRHLRMSERTRQVELQAAAREHAAKLGEELAANLSTEHAQNLERLERQLSNHDEELIEERAKHRMVPF